MLTTRYPWGVTMLLLCTLLLQSCQLQLNVLEEGPPAETSLQDNWQPPASEALTQPISCLLSSLSTTADHQPRVLPASPPLPLLSVISLPTASAGFPTSLGIHPTAIITSSVNILTTPAPLRPAAMPSASHVVPLRSTSDHASSLVFTTASGKHVRFSRVEGQWLAAIQAGSDISTLQHTLPVVGTANVGGFLSWLQGQDRWISSTRIHILHTPRAPYGSCVYLGKVGLLGGMPGDEEEDSKPLAKRPFPNLEDALAESNKKARDGERWVQGPCIQLRNYVEEETYHWDIPEGYAFLGYKVLGNNTDDTRIAIKQTQDNHNDADQKTSKQYAESKVELSIGSQGQEEAVSRSNASLEITATRKVMASGELSGHKNDSDVDDFLVIQVLLCLGEATTISHQVSIDPKEVQRNLKEHYNKNFALAPPLFGETRGPSKEVKTLQCTLQLIEPTDEQKKYRILEDDVAIHHVYRECKKKAIALGDLFQKRSIKPEGAVCEINKVLVVGDAGMGKTTLSRKIAYLWARGEWGKEFEAVYVLPVRALQKSQYDDTSYRKEATLPTAIIDLCFTPPTDEATYEALRTHIDSQLKAATTLVVLDGLDERSGASEVLLSQAKTGNNKLLMFSRSCGIAEERTLADIEVENTGLSEQQMRDYVIDESLSGLPEDQGNHFLLQLAKHPSISEVAHVPVNLEMLCLLWRDRNMQAIASQAMNQGSLPSLYRVLTQYIWERYVTEGEKSKLRVETANQASLSIDNRDALFDTLGKVAVRTFEEREILIGQGLVQELAEGSVLENPEVMKHAGFWLLQWLEDSGRYQFPHLAFQEYFAGRWLAKQLSSEDKDEKQEAESFFKANKYEPRYGRIFSFIAGEISKEKGQEGIHQLLSLTNEGAQEVLGLHHMSLQMRLLNEWLCVRSKEEVKMELRKLEKAFKVLTSFKKWFVKGIEVIRKDEGSALLKRLTSLLQDVRAVASFVAPQCFEVLLAGVKDKDIRRATLDAFEKVAQTVPDMVSQCLPFLLAAVEDENKDVCGAALDALAKVAQAAPDVVPQCLPVLLATVTDKDQDVRQTTLWALSKVAKTAPARCLPPLVAAVKDEDEAVRGTALYALVQVAQAAPDTAPQCLEVLLAAIKDGDREVRQAALGAIVQVAQAASDMGPQFLEVLLATVKDEDEEVRRVALRALGQVVQVAPDMTPQCLPPLLAAVRDKDGYEDEEILWTVLDTLVEVVQAAPDVALQCLEVLLAAAADPDEDIRWAVQDALTKVAKTDPSRCLPSLLVAVRDENVLGAALEALAKVVQAVPDIALQFLEVLLVAIQNQNKDVRVTALEALVEVARAVPGMVPQCLEALVANAMDQDGDVRCVVLEALGQVAQAAPDIAPRCLEVLLANAVGENVRRATLEALARVAQAAPDMAPQCLSFLLAATMDKNIRWATFEPLAKVAQAAPDMAPQCLEVLLAAAMDQDVCRAALGALEQVSLEQLVNAYWATQREKVLISIIRPRLYQTPLVVIPSASDSQWCIVLYENAEISKKWDKPRKEIERLASGVAEDMGMSRTSR
jgi:HEAT repeat protein